MMMTAAEVVIVEWSDLIIDDKVNDDNDYDNDYKRQERLQAALKEAYGPTGTGILGIRGMPGFVPAKQAFLPMAHTLATKLPPGYLETHLTDATSLYNAGWSHGKEKLGEQKPPDTAKASFYYNPVTDTPGTDQDRLDYPLSYPCNMWPDEALMPDFKRQAKALGSLLKEACVAVAHHLDAFVLSQQPTYPPNLLTNCIRTTDKVKARLLYYFPLSEQDSTTNNKTKEAMDETQDDAVIEDSWIGWHNDSGFLTALAGDLYINHKTGQEIPTCPDPSAGLYVINRKVNNGSERGTDQSIALKVIIPPDCVAVQVGECTQIISGGTIQATPHCVRGCGRGTSNVARVSLPCFVDTVPAFLLQMPSGCTREQVLAADCSHHKVPPLALRWKGDMTFGDFLQTTFATYYNWKS